MTSTRTRTIQTNVHRLYADWTSCYTYSKLLSNLRLLCRQMLFRIAVLFSINYLNDHIHISASYCLNFRFQLQIEWMRNTFSCVFLCFFFKLFSFPCVFFVNFKFCADWFCVNANAITLFSTLEFWTVFHCCYRRFVGGGGITTSKIDASLSHFWMCVRACVCLRH